jgi:Zn finger protein HypA/HybF involved in hydrogenase expression
MKSNRSFRIYKPKCKRCGEYYESTAKHSKICPKCWKEPNKDYKNKEYYVRNCKLTELGLKRIGVKNV